jgi:hypothetical protein
MGGKEEEGGGGGGRNILHLNLPNNFKIKSTNSIL